jgi:multidrug efflux pump subunit AcrB
VQGGQTCNRQTEPLVIPPSGMTDLRHPPGISIVRGLIVSQLLTLYTTRWFIFTLKSCGSGYEPA